MSVVEVRRTPVEGRPERIVSGPGGGGIGADVGNSPARRQVVNALGPGVAAHDGEPARHPLFGAQLQRMVTGVYVLRVLADTAIDTRRTQVARRQSRVESKSTASNSTGIPIEPFFDIP